MPLGASITHGFLSSDKNGYREHLRNSIIEGGNDVDMVGNNPEGDMEDNENEGWPGLIIDEVREKAERKGEKLPETKAFDSNCITPGTFFLEYAVRRRRAGRPHESRVCGCVV